MTKDNSVGGGVVDNTPPLNIIVDTVMNVPAENMRVVGVPMGIAMANDTCKIIKEDVGDMGRCYGKPWKTGKNKTNQSACIDDTILRVAE